MWETHGFICDTNVTKLGEVLKEKGINCITGASTDSEQICSIALENDYILITSNLKLFNRKSVLNRVCVHYKDNVQKQMMALKGFFSFE